MSQGDLGYVIVTGATGGIGRAVVKDLVTAGYGVWALGRDEGRLRGCFGVDAAVEVLECNLSDERAIAQGVKAITEKTGPVRGLVHLAGFDKLTPLYLAKRKNAEELMSAHVYSAMDLCKCLSKKGNAAQGCSVVLISSLSAHEGAAGHSQYAAAKGALEGYLPSAACELAQRGIRLNVLTLGVVRTEMSQGFIGKLDEEQLLKLEESYPLGVGVPDDVAPVVRFLISDDSHWITGQTIVADGGHMVRSV